MTIGNEEIGKYVEMGARAVSIYKTKINDNEISFKWRPLRETEYTMALSDAFESVPSQVAKWIISKPDVRQKMKDDGIVVPSSHIRRFDDWLNVYIIFYGIEWNYPGVTAKQIFEMDIDHTDFADLISEASGNKSGQETASTFPANESEQVIESTS